MININSYLKNIPIEIEEIIINHCDLNVIPSLSKFKNLKILKCDNNNLTELPKLPDNLQELYCYCNKLTQLPVLPFNLKILQCHNNKLIKLPKLHNNLNILMCSFNNLIELPELPNNLQELICDYNYLTELPELPDSLQEILCYNNKLTKLPKLSNNLKILECDYNKLTKLPNLPDSLKELNCRGNNLLSMPLLPLTLKVLYYENNIIYNIIYNKLRDGKMSYTISVEQLNKINKKQEILNNFKFLYHCLKFKIKLRKWLWIHVRESKMKEICHPSLLLKLLDKDINEETFENITESFGKTIFN